MAGVNKLTGSPWHAEKMTRKEGDPRRHRSKCIHYQKATDHCTRQCMKCTGSGHCDYYSEQIAYASAVVSTPKQSSAQINLTQEEELLEHKIRQVGQKVRHSIYGKGMVTKSTSSTVEIEFESGKIAKFAVGVCVAERKITLL